MGLGEEMSKGRPKAVRSAVERSEELAQSILERQKGIKDQSAEDVLSRHTGEPDNTDDGPGSTPQDTDSSQLTDTPSNTDENTELQEKLRISDERYRALKRKYDVEVPKLHKELRDANADRDELKARLDTLEQQVSQRTERQASNTQSFDRAREQLVNELPEDAVDAFTELTEAIIANRMPEQSNSNSEKLETDLGELRSELQNLRQQSALEKMDQLVPEWRELNGNDGFNDWLDDSYEELSGKQYRELLSEAWQAGVLERVVRFFRLYLNERQQEVQQQNTGPKNQTQDIDADGTGHGPADKSLTPKPDDGNESFSLAEIKDIEARARRGEFKGRKNELNLLRDKIARAAAAGRIT